MKFRYRRTAVISYGLDHTTNAQDLDDWAEIKMVDSAGENGEGAYEDGQKREDHRWGEDNAAK